MEWSTAEQRGAHSLERVGNRDRPRNSLQVWRQNRDRIHHAAQQPGESEQNPFGGIAAREKQDVAAPLPNSRQVPARRKEIGLYLLML